MSLFLKHHNVAKGLGVVNPNYTITIKAWKMEQFFEELKLFDNDDNSQNMFLASIGEVAMMLGQEIVDVASDVLTDLKNTIKENSVSEIASAGLDKLASGMATAGVKLHEYTSGANAKVANKIGSNEFYSAFVFPVPENLTDSLKHTYDTDTFSPLEVIGSMGKKLTKKIFKGEGIARISDAALKFNIEQAKRNNIVFDNNLINIYKNTEQRDFIFNFTLIPQSYEHYKEILRAYASLKVLMTGAKVGGSMGMVQKYCFTINFENPYFEQYMVLDETIELNLETLELDVSGSPFTSFENGSVNQGTGVPKNIQMIMTFKERRPLRDDINLDTPLGKSGKAKETKEVKK